MIIGGFGRKGCDNKDDEDEESLLFGSSMIIAALALKNKILRFFFFLFIFLKGDFEVLSLRIYVFEWWFE